MNCSYFFGFRAQKFQGAAFVYMFLLLGLRVNVHASGARYPRNPHRPKGTPSSIQSNGVHRALGYTVMELLGIMLKELASYT